MVAVEQVFTSLLLDVLPKRADLLRELANRTTDIARHVKTLSITIDSECDDIDALELATAISTLQRVTSVSYVSIPLHNSLIDLVCRWTCLTTVDPTFLRLISDTLSSLPRLCSLRLHVGSEVYLPHLPFHDLTNLEATFVGTRSWTRFMLTAFPSICSASPNLHSLSLSNPISNLRSRPTAHAFRPLCRPGVRELYLRQIQLPFVMPVDDSHILHSLSSLTLHDTPEMNALWLALQNEGVALRAVDVASISGALVDYLLSYEGMQSLQVRTSEDNPANDQFGRVFWDEVVRRHRESLVSVSVRPFFEGTWCFPANDAGLETLRSAKWKTLSVAFKFESIKHDLVSCCVHPLSYVSS